MASYDEEDDADDLIFLSLVLTAGYVLYNLWRNLQAAPAGTVAFAPAPPAPADPTETFFDILVPMQLSPNGAAFIKANEGWQPNAYPDGKGHSSIGYGHQIQPGEKFVSPITRQEGDDLFDADAAAASQAVSQALKVQVSQSQFDALVDLAYNIGVAAFTSSTLLRLLNAGDFAGAAQQFAVWRMSNGQVNQNLVARRSADLDHFNS